MTWAKHDGEGEREEDKENHERDGNAKASATLGGRDGRNGGGRGGLGWTTSPFVLLDDLIRTQPQGASVGPQETTGEDLTRELFEATILDAVEHLEGDAGGLR
jgi:hypothetical protein